MSAIPDPEGIVALTEEEIGEQFNVETFTNLLKTAVFGRKLFHYPSIPSTQVYMYQNVSKFPEGSCVLADVQTSGRGRGDNLWTSPRGCLMFSFKCGINKGVLLPFFQYLISLALVQSIRKLNPALEDLSVSMKWPNDIYGAGLKIGGVLCQTDMVVDRSAGQPQFAVVSGVGLNVSNAEPTTSVNKLIADHGVNVALSREEVLAGFFNEFEPMFTTFVEHGFDSFRPAYQKYWLHSNQVVTVDEGEKGRTQIRLTGLAPSGFLQGEDEGGNVFELHPDGNSFDFFQGLIKRKIQSASSASGL